MYFCDIFMGIYQNIGHTDFTANVRMLKFGSELRYGIRSPNVRTPVDIPSRYPDEGYRNYRNSIWLTFSPSHWSHGSVSGSVAAGQNSELCHKLTALQNGFLHIDILTVIVFPLVIGFGSITLEILVNALSDRYTHWSSVHNKKRHSCIGNETETYENRNFLQTRESTTLKS